MDKILSNMVAGETVVEWLIILFLVGFFAYKEWPELKRRLTSGVKEEDAIHNMATRLSAIEADVKDIKAKMETDYQRLNQMESEIEHNKKGREEDREEMMIIMQAILASLKGLQKLGCNGPVTEQIDALSSYLTARAHGAEWRE